MNLIYELLDIRKNISEYNFKISSYEDGWNVLGFAFGNSISKLDQILEFINNKSDKNEIQQLIEANQRFLKNRGALPITWMISLFDVTIEKIKENE